MTQEEHQNICNSLILAAILRNGTALSNMIGHMRGINERPFLNRREIKQLKNRIEKEFAGYENEMRAVLYSKVNDTSDEDIYEALLDAEVEYSKPVRQDLDAYCNAIEHIMLKMGVKEHRWLAQLTTAVHFVGLCAYIQAYEYEDTRYFPLRKMLKMGGTVSQVGTYNKIVKVQTQPSVMGHFSQIGKTLVNMIVRKYGINPEYTYESDDPHDPILRAIEMHSGLLIETLQDYGVIRALFGKIGTTIEEANRLADEEDERINKLTQTKTK